MSTAAELRQAVLDAVGFAAEHAAAGNVTLGRGTLDGRPLRVALIENRVASGSIGTLEAGKLGALLKVAAADRSPVLVCIDSAGARVSEGLKALGAFRSLYRAGLDAALRGVPIAAVVGRNCFGGASMLAHLASQRLLSDETQLAMSGPAVIASASGMNPVDDMFRAMAQATLSAAARAKTSAANALLPSDGNPLSWLREALAPRGDMVEAYRMRHEALAARIGTMPLQRPWETVRRRDLEKLYDGGCEARESDGILDGSGARGSASERFVGLVGNSALSAARAWRFADIVWKLLADPPARLEVFLDCATHAARLEEEKLILTEFVVDMGAALASLGRRGADVGLTVTGKAGGGVYVALAAPARRVASLYGADIQVLPGSAVAAILGEARESVPAFDDYRAAGVADEEIKLGFVPGNP
jgi:hypothetical protein